MLESIIMFEGFFEEGEARKTPRHENTKAEIIIPKIKIKILTL